MCPLVVESSISSSPLLLAVNDRQSQSHQLDSTSSTGNQAPLISYKRHSVTHIHFNIITCTHPPGYSEGPADLQMQISSQMLSDMDVKKHQNTGFHVNSRHKKPPLSITKSPLNHNNLCRLWTPAPP